MRVFFAIALVCGWAQSSPAQTPGKVITDLAELWRFTGADRDRPHPVRFEMLVDYYDHDWRMVWGRCGGVGNYLTSGDTPLSIEVGQHYLVEGEMTPSRGLTLANTRITHLPGRTEPPVIPASHRLGDTGELQNQLVEIEGVVQRQSLTDERHLVVEVLVENFPVHCRVLIPPRAPIPELQDVQIRVRGVYIAQTTPLGQLAQLNIWVQDVAQIVPTSLVVQDDRFNLPIVSIETLPRFSAETPVRVAGAVHKSEPGKSVTLRDYTGQVKVLTNQTRPLRVGEFIEAVGTPSIRANDWTLQGGAFRLRGSIGDPDRNEEGTLRLVDQVLALRQEAAEQHPVRLTGVITWVRASARFVYIQDATAGIRVRLPEGFMPNREMLYGFVEVKGTTATGKFAPEVEASEIIQHGQTSFPVSRPVTLEQAMTGVEESQWIEMRGHVRTVTQEATWTWLALISSSGEFKVQVPGKVSLNALVGALVRVNGVAVAEANDQRELTGVILLAANPDSIQVEEPAPADPFAEPARTIASLRQYNPLQTFHRRARLTGTVLYHQPGRHLYVEDGESTLLVLSRDLHPVAIGDQVEVSGLPGREGHHIVLRESVYRKTGYGTLPAPATPPVDAPPDESLDGNLVTFTARLVETGRRQTESRLLLQNGGTAFEARLDGWSGDLPAIGSELRLTGIYQLEFDEYRQPRGFHLRLRSIADLETLSTPSWWTARRAFYMVGLLFACVLGVIGWVSILRRRVKQQTSQLREQIEKEALLEARHRDIINNASDFIFTLDHEGRLTSFNPAGERMTGLARDRALGRSFRDLLAPDDSAHPLPIFSLRSENDAAITCQTRFKTADGRIIWVEICARAIREPGRPHGLLAVARDISERKQIEEELLRARDAAEANTRAKSAFLANMSHEIRTPMNGVIGMSNLILDTRLSDEQRDFAETIRNSAESLLTVLNDILDFSKIEAGKLQFETIDFDLHETVESTLELLAARASDKGLELASFLPSDLPRWIRGDPGRLRQVLLNLIGNAIKFTDKGEVVVAVALERETDNEVRLHFEITDTGPGLDVDIQSRLFQPFSQADGSTTRKFGGTGLGLAISKQIVELMDGQIGVRSTPGEGATFWFTARLDKQPYGTPQEQTPRVTALSGLRALVVDDNATNRKILQHYCVAWGVRSEPVASAAAALAALREAADAGDPFQLVLTDYQMPGMDGLMLARETQADSKISGARVILLTSWDRRFTREELNASGVIRMLVKPIRQQDLLGALLRCVRIGFGTNSGGTNLPSRSSPPGEEPAPPPPQTGRSLRVLIAEDNIVNQRVATLQLRNLGHTVEIAANGLEVLKALETASYDVIFMDGQMPELDGYETTRRIRLNPAIAGIRIIAMTANAMQGDRERCLEAGMDDYISKPTRLDDLNAALARCDLHATTSGPFDS